MRAILLPVAENSIGSIPGVSDTNDYYDYKAFAIVRLRSARRHRFACHVDAGGAATREVRRLLGNRPGIARASTSGWSSSPVGVQVPLAERFHCVWTLPLRNLRCHLDLLLDDDFKGLTIAPDSGR